MKIYNYIDATEFAEFIETTFKIKGVYHRLLEFEYIEKSMGSLWNYEEPYKIPYEDDKEQEIINEVQSWFNEFLEEFDVEEIQLKY